MGVDGTAVCLHDIFSIDDPRIHPGQRDHRVPEPTILVLLAARLAMIGGLALRSPQARDTTSRRYEGTHR